MDYILFATNGIFVNLSYEIAFHTLASHKFILCPEAHVKMIIL